MGQRNQVSLEKFAFRSEHHYIHGCVHDMYFFFLFRHGQINWSHWKYSVHSAALIGKYQWKWKRLNNKSSPQLCRPRSNHPPIWEEKKLSMWKWHIFLNLLLLTIVQRSGPASARGRKIKRDWVAVGGFWESISVGQTEPLFVRHSDCTGLYWFCWLKSLKTIADEHSRRRRRRELNSLVWKRNVSVSM